MQKHGPWKIKRTKIVYKNPWMTVREDAVIRPDGKPGIVGIVKFFSGVGVIALDRKKNVYLTKEFHYAVGKTTLEAISGGIESGENRLQAAKRELKEEAGLVAKKWTYLGSLYPLTSLVRIKNHLYMAQELTQKAAMPEGTEKIKIVKMPVKRALRMVENGTINDATSCLALLKVAELIVGGKKK